MTNIWKWDSGGSVSMTLLLGILLAVATDSAGSCDQKTELRCFLDTSLTNICPTPLDEVPDRLVQLYSNLSFKLKQSCRQGKLSVLSPQDLADIPAPLLLLIPTKQLKYVPGSALAWNIQKHLDDTVIASKMIEALDFPKYKFDFFKNLEGIELPQRTQDILAQSMIRWQPDIIKWRPQMFTMIEKVGDPLLAHIPPYFLPTVTENLSTEFLFYFRNWQWHRSSNYSWQGKSEAQKRAWMNIVLHNSYPYNISQWTPGDAQRFSFFLEGATPDELKLLNENQMPSQLLRTNLNKLQARTVFDIVYKTSHLGNKELANILPIALKLSPSNLQKFQANKTDFSILTPDDKCSFVTAKQIVESLIAQAMLSKQLKSIQPDNWRKILEHIGKFVYVLDTDVLERYRPPPSLPFLLSKIDSNKITRRQARLLLGGDKYIVDKPEILMGQRGLLRTVSSFQIVAGNMKQYFQEHLLQNLPSGSIMQTAALLQKFIMHLDDSVTLENMLSNPDAGQFFELLASHQVAAIYPVLERILDFSENNQIQTAIKALPQNVLSVMLRISKEKLKNKRNLWTSDTLLSDKNKLFLLGMTCNDINAIDPVDFIHIMGHYNRERQKIKKIFPKNLQYCSQMALIQYLEMKATLQQGNTKRYRLDSLEPPEIEAVGGYVLANLPLEDIEKAMYNYQILEAIGRLPLTELLVATKETNVHSLAKLIVNFFANYENYKIESVQLFSLGNLFHFLQPDDILKISPSAFKLYLESVEDSTTKMVCGNSEVRAAFYDTVVKAFGKPFTWTAGILATLGDFLLVVPPDELTTIPLSSLRDAADVLVDQTSYHLHIEWPGATQTVPFFQACSELLSENEALQYIKAVHWLGRWRLMAVQIQMETVAKSQQLLSGFKHAENTRVLVPDLEVPSRVVVQVLEPSEERQLIPPTEINEQSWTTTPGLTSNTVVSMGPTLSSSNVVSAEVHLHSTMSNKEVVKPSLEENGFSQESNKIGEVENGANTLSSHSADVEEVVVTQSSGNAANNSRGLLAFLSESVAVLEAKAQNKLDIQNEADLTNRDKRKIEGILHEHEEIMRWSNMHEQSGELLREIVLASQNAAAETNHSSNSLLTTTENADPYIPSPWPKISCDAIRAAGLSAVIGLNEKDIQEMDLVELDKCIDTLGSLELEIGIQKRIWSRMNKEKFIDELALMGKLVKAIEEKDIPRLNLNLNSVHGLDNLAALGHNIKDSFLLEAISIRFTQNNPSLTSITTELVVALGQILCEIITVPRQKLLFEYSVFFNASPILGKIQDCPIFCLKKLTQLATRNLAFGSPESWTADDIATLGTIMAGLDVEQWRKLDSKAFVGLSPSAVKCIPPTVFKELSEDQLKSVPLLSTAVISEVQLSYLSMQQKATLERCLKPEPKFDARASATSVTKDLLLVIVTVISILLV